MQWQENGIEGTKVGKMPSTFFFTLHWIKT